METSLNFSWIIEDRLSASSLPNSFKKLNWLIKVNGIDVIISLTEHSLSKHVKKFKEYKSKLNFKHYDIPTIDGTGFFPHQFMKLNKIYSKSEENKVLIHCMGGYGRTSTALSAIWMMEKKKSLKSAIKDLKEIRPQFMITSIQKESLKVWEAYLIKMKNYK